MKIGVKLTILLVAALLVAASGCRGKKKDDFKPSPLACQLESGMPQAKVMKTLHLASSDFTVVEDYRPLVTDSRPPFYTLTLSRTNMNCGGQTGELQLTFFNDRLMTTLLFADHYEALRAASVDDNTGDRKLEPNTRVWAGRDHDGRNYVGWMDLKLKREYDAWLNEYNH